MLVDPERVRTRAHDLVNTSQEFLDASWANAAAGNAIPVDLRSILDGGSYWALSDLRDKALAGERAWWSFILVVGFLGAALVARRIAGLSAGAACVTGVAYALSASVYAVTPASRWPNSGTPTPVGSRPRARSQASGMPSPSLSADSIRLWAKLCESWSSWTLSRLVSVLFAI